MNDHSTEAIIARIDEKLEANNRATFELLKIVKGDNGQGLCTRVALLEQTAETDIQCPNNDSVRWLTWGFRSIMVAIIGTALWFLRAR